MVSIQSRSFFSLAPIGGEGWGEGESSVIILIASYFGLSTGFN